MRLKAKTTMRINFLVKMIMIMLFVLGAFVFFVDISKAAIWKTNLNQCPDTYGSQYSPGKALCGVDVGGNAQWVLPNEFLPNVGNVTSTAISQYGGLSNGGFVVDCEAYRSPAPYCNNSSVAGVNTLWCNPSATCYSGGNNRETVCQTNIWASAGASAFECGNCLPTYNNCDTDDDNCEIKNGNSCGTNAVFNGCNGSPGSGVDGNCVCSSGFYDCSGVSYDSNCEISQGSSCFIGDLEGTWQCSVGAGSCWVDSATSANCECVLSIQIFETGVETRFSTSSLLLWGTQYGDGDLIKFSKNNISTNTFMVKNDGSVGIGTDSFDSNVAALVVSSTSKGILIPRLTTAQRDGVSGVDGLLLYNTDNKEFNFFNASTSAWESVGKTYSSGSGLSLNGTTFSVNFDEFTLTTTSGKLAVKYDPVFFTTNTYGLTFKYDEGFFTTSSLGLMLKDIGVVSSTYGSENTAVTLGIDNYGRVYFVATSTIMIGIDNITNSSSLARVDMENTFSSPTTFTATTTHQGGVRSNLYCDVSGNNCFDPNAFGWATPQARYMNTTTANYNGNFGSFPAASGTIGYEAANHICSSTVGTDYHICQANEILDIIRIYGTSTFAGKTNGWVANGPPGYVTVSTNDCEGYTTSTVSFYGAWWKFNDSSGGGSGKMTNCSTLQPIACCK